MGSGKSLFDCEKFGLHNSDHSTSLDLLETQEMEAKNSSSKAVIEILTISDLLYTKVPNIYKKKLELSNIKLQQKNKPPKEIDILSIKKIITFLVSIIVHVAFPKMEVWFQQVMASLS
ncbi:9695_t:CDS:2 [Entrophospora sp. SA101]|nr:9695_t:CDS:2 [Entrophospora sp. SA101]